MWKNKNFEMTYEIEKEINRWNKIEQRHVSKADKFTSIILQFCGG